jgi:hypothetical protein
VEIIAQDKYNSLFLNSEEESNRTSENKAKDITPETLKVN